MATARRSNTAKKYAADATQEYRGTITVVADANATMELGDDDLGGVPLQSKIAEAMLVRAKSIAPVAVDVKGARSTRPGPSAPPGPPPTKRSPDASLEFPHPVSPELFAEDSNEAVELPDFDDELLPPRERPRWRYMAFTGVMVLAGVLVGLGIGSRSRASSSTVDAPTQNKPTERKSIDLPTLAKTTTTETTSAAAKPAEPTTGTIVSPKWAKNRRVFMDGKEIGKSGELDAACGAHVVQIGLAGKAKKVTIPCGGKVTVIP